MIFLRAGGNDIHNGKTPEQVFDDFKKFVSTVHGKLPETDIAFISLSPSIARWEERDANEQLNTLIEGYVQGKPRLKFIDTWSISLDAKGQPRPEPSSRTSCTSARRATSSYRTRAPIHPALWSTRSSLPHRCRGERRLHAESGAALTGSLSRRVPRRSDPRRAPAILKERMSARSGAATRHRSQADGHSWDSSVCCRCRAGRESAPRQPARQAGVYWSGHRRAAPQRIARWVARAAPGEPMHLWVMEGNLPARRFYYRQVGTVAERSIVDDGPAKGLPVMRYVWPPL